MVIHVLGFYDRSNVGDEAFRPAINDIFAGHDVQFFNIDDYKNLPTPDFLVLGGGDVVTPYYLPTASRIPCRKIGLGVGFGYESENNLAVQANFDGWFLRNKNDLDLIASQSSVPVEYTPDLAFHIKPSGKKVIHRYCKTDKPVVALLLTDYLLPSGLRREDIFWNRSKVFMEDFGPFCTRLANEGFQVLAVPCSTDFHADDRRVHSFVQSYAGPEMICVQEILQPQEMIDLLVECKYTICQRFHSHVFAMIAGVPIMSVGFTRKVKKILVAGGASVDVNCFKDGHYVGADFWRMFCKMQEEADKMNICFLKFAASNRVALLEVKQKVLRLMYAKSS